VSLDALQQIFQAMDISVNIPNGFNEIMDMLNTNINDKSIQNVGIVATIALFLQMRYSHAARRTVSNVAHGTIALGLCSVSITTLGSVQCKKRLMEFLNSKLPKGELQVPSYDRASTFGRRFLGGSQIMVFPAILQSFLSRLRRDDRFRRRWQGIAALVVLYLFRQRGQRRKLGKTLLR